MVDFPLCSRLLKETHKILLEGVRGQFKNPGDFRPSQNWIGTSGSTITNASFVPPNVDDMRNSINELDKFINEDNSLHPIISCALIHYQFETIHPFLDGNGRIGRMLILLYLMNKGILTTPVLTISYYLKRHQLEYYDRISEVRKTGNYEQWVNFFLQAIITSVNDEIESINELNTLKEITTKRIQESYYSNHDTLVLLEFIKYLEQKPIISIGKTKTDLNISFNSVSTIILKLESLNVLIQENKGEKTKYSFTRNI